MKYLSIIAIFIFASCGSSSTDESKKDDSEKKDTSEVSDQTNETTEDVVVDENTNEVIVKNPENTSIEAFEKNNDGMSFCDCVKKSNELDEKMMEEEDDDKIDALMAEKDKLISTECAVLKVGGQSSPEERAARMRKVKACLSK